MDHLNLFRMSDIKLSIVIDLNLRHSIEHRARNEIFEPGFLHRGFRHRDARFVGTLHRLGGVDDHLGGHDVVGLRWIERVAFDVFDDVHVLVGLHARGHGPHDFLFVINVDVGIDDHDMLDEVAAAERGQRRLLGLAVDFFVDGDVAVEAAAA